MTFWESLDKKILNVYWCVWLKLVVTPAPKSLYKVSWRRACHSWVAQDWWDILGPLISHFFWISMEKRFILVSLLFLHFLSSMLTSAPLRAGRIGGKFKLVIDGSGRRFGREAGGRWSVAGPWPVCQHNRGNAPNWPGGLVTTSILLCWIFTIKDQHKKVCFLQTHNQGLERLFLALSWAIDPLSGHSLSSAALF